MPTNDLASRLLSIRQLPALPVVAGEALRAIDDPETSASKLGRIIERDQALAARLLVVANSPIYGCIQEISTIDLAIVVIGFSTVREVVMSYVLQGMLSKARTPGLDLNAFWRYAVYCGTASRIVARKLGYRLAGEAFVAGLLHDIGIFILAHYAQSEYAMMRKEQRASGETLEAAESRLLGINHAEIGARLAQTWNLPPQLQHAIGNHHRIPTADAVGGGFSPVIDRVEHPLTALTAAGEALAMAAGMKEWAGSSSASWLYLPEQLLDTLLESAVTDRESSLTLLIEEITTEYERSMGATEVPR